jgi:N-acetylmuramoyl-L-alanine amidase
VNAQLTVKQGWYQASLTSGNPAAVASASQVYNSTDLYWLSRIISAEAKGESLEGQIAVGNVVLNRVRSSEFPSTVKEVIFDTKYGVQFSPVSNGTIYDTPTESAVLAAKICLEGYSLSDSALYFFNPALATSSWIKRSRTYIMTIGNHAFYA